MPTHHYLACDLGAESGRIMLGTLASDRLTIEEIHRFPNGAIAISNSLRWDILRLFEEVKVGLGKATARGVSVSSVSCDSWGVDYVLLHGDEPMLAPPFHYRDNRTDGGMERAFGVVPAGEIFAETGIQFLFFNTLYQLHADLLQRPGIFHLAERFLNIGDYFNFLLSGVARAEESLASTTQLYNPRQRTWSKKLIEKFGFPARIFPEIVPSGAILGPLLPALATETGLQEVQVVAGCSHDTGAAVAAVPAEGEDWAYLSSGTWSLLGVESAAPIITARSRQINFTNEVGHGGSIRFLKNIIGLWIVQECRRAWVKTGEEYSYEQLAQMAETAVPLRSFINPNNARFAKPDHMPQKIADYCRETNQNVPATPAEFIRCVLESLAMLYRQTLDQIEEVTGRGLKTLHIVGGGCKNQLLNQLSANATGRTVVAGPAECTAIGNVLIQAIALGHLPSLAAARQVVRDSFPTSRFEPREGRVWEEAYKTYRSILI
jgi:rhamnulokinase